MNGSLKQLMQSLTADRRKLTLMVGLLAVAMLLWGRLLLKEVPRTATAVPEATARAQASDATIVPTMTQGSNADQRVIRVELPRAVSRDLFALSPTLMPLVVEPVQTNVRSEKSPADSADDMAGLLVVQRQAEQLRLSSIMLGQSPRVVINGQPLALGQQVEGFTLVRVFARSVVMEKNGYQVRVGL